MKKRVLSVALMAATLVSMFAGCSGSSSSSSSGSSSAAGNSSSSTSSASGSTASSGGDSSSPENRTVLEYDTIFVISKDRIPDDPSLLDEKLLNDFGIKMKWQQIPSSGAKEKLNLIFASKDIPDMMWPVGVTDDIPKRFGMDGFLLPINEYFDKLPNYRKLFSDEEWNNMLESEVNADGNLYYIPQKNYRDTAGAWIYRKSAFDEMGLTFPETLDDLYTVLKTIKEKDPESVPMPNSGGLNVLDGLYLAYGIKKDSYVDTKTNELVGYGRMTDAYREVLKTAAKYWQEGLIDKEFSTATEQQWTEKYANGKAYIQYSYATRCPWAEENMKAVDPNVDFEWSRVNVTADPEYGFWYSKETPYVKSGPFFTEEMEGEKMDRMLEFFDWLSTEEGSRFICMGEEGVTYEMVDGHAQFMSHMYHSERNPEGKHEWAYGLYLGNLVQDPDYIIEVGKGTDLELTESMRSNPKAHALGNIAWKFTEEEEKRINNLDAVIKDTADEAGMKFIMGQLDPNSDSDWENYIKTMEGVGVNEAIEIRKKAAKF